MTFDAILSKTPPPIQRPPQTARVTRVDGEGVWAVPLGGDMRTPVGPCRGSATVGDTCLIVWTQELPWVLSAATVAAATAGGVLSGTYPDPGFAVDMATQAELDAVAAAKAPLASPTFTGDPKAPTPATSDSDTSIATTAFVKAAITAAAAAGSASFTVGSTLVQWGSFGTSLSGATVSGTLTFPIAFSGTPTGGFVTIATSAANKLIASLQTPSPLSTTALQWTVKTGDGTSSSANPTVYWAAIGPV